MIKNSCIECGKCLKICPVEAPKQARFSSIKSYAFYSENNSKSGRASSSGVFEALAKVIINNNGVVCGAAFDDSWNVRHILVNRIEDVYKLCTSKYSQSFIDNDLYCKVRDALKKRVVLFVGTPCQVAAINRFIKNKNNLITVDLVCHGVPSPKVWESYLKYMSNGKKIIDINFRDKKYYSYYGLKIVYENEEFYEPVMDNIYLQGYISNLFLRNSCSQCEFKGYQHNGDITLGDLWRAEKIDEYFKNKYNISWVIVNTKVGEEMISNISSLFTVRDIEIQREIKYNQSYIRSINHHRNRDKFFKEFAENEKEIEQIIKYNIKENWPKQFLNRIKRIVKLKMRR